jgi:hypothetical protein
MRRLYSGLRPGTARDTAEVGMRNPRLALWMQQQFPCRAAHDNTGMGVSITFGSIDPRFTSFRHQVANRFAEIAAPPLMLSIVEPGGKFNSVPGWFEYSPGKMPSTIKN